jgi:transglutaminase-like putative cysteine protease
MYKKGHCGHRKNVLAAMCSMAGIPSRTVAGLSLYKPDGVGQLDETRSEFGNAHTWAQIYLSGSGWIEIDPSLGDRAYSIPAQLVQNNMDFQNYMVRVCENGRWKSPGREYRDGKWYSPYGIENHNAFRRVQAN